MSSNSGVARTSGVTRKSEPSRIDRRATTTQYLIRDFFFSKSGDVNFGVLLSNFFLFAIYYNIKIKQRLLSTSKYYFLKYFQ